MMTMKYDHDDHIIMKTMAHDDHKGQDGHDDYDGFGVVTQPTTHPCLSFLACLVKKKHF